MAAASRTRDFQAWSANAAPDEFYLNAGIFGLTVFATVWGTATLQKLLPDGVTWVACSAAIAANGYTAPIYLPSGRYRLVLAGTTLFAGVIEKISALRS